jgi:hypothetical protein
MKRLQRDIDMNGQFVGWTKSYESIIINSIRWIGLCYFQGGTSYTWRRSGPGRLFSAYDSANSCSHPPRDGADLSGDFSCSLHTGLQSINNLIGPLPCPIPVKHKSRGIWMKGLAPALTRCGAYFSVVWRTDYRFRVGHKLSSGFDLVQPKVWP